MVVDFGSLQLGHDGVWLRLPVGRMGNWTPLFPARFPFLVSGRVVFSVDCSCRDPITCWWLSGVERPHNDVRLGSERLRLERHRADFAPLVDRTLGLSLYFSLRRYCGRVEPGADDFTVCSRFCCRLPPASTARNMAQQVRPTV